MPIWRAMTAGDLAAVTAISAAVHGAYAEPVEVYAERLALYPAGCFTCEAAGEARGFLVSHPWRRGAAPALGASLGAIPVPAETYYLHDVALLPQARGLGAGGAVMPLVETRARAAGCAEIALVAVNGAEGYWARHGFVAVGDGGYGPGTHLMRKAI
jgi:GNAT superfamily N-acetyltransferase